MTLQNVLKNQTYKDQIDNMFGILVNKHGTIESAVTKLETEKTKSIKFERILNELKVNRKIISGL